MSEARTFIIGMLTMGYVVVALFFLRFWTRTHDRLFAYFSGAFALLAVQRVGLVLANETTEDTTWLFLLRLAAFLLIVFAILSKNRKRKGSP